MVQNLENWYEVREVGEGILTIDERGTNIMYLVRGEEKCLLLDTGWGVGNLSGLVESLCALPLIVENSHGHPDHTFGNGLFPEVQIHPAVKFLVQEPPTPEIRQWIYDNADEVLGFAFPAAFELDGWATSVPKSIVSIHEGDSFDLGNRNLEVIELAGHSTGSIGLLDRMTRSLFVGDSIHTGSVATIE